MSALGPSLRLGVTLVCFLEDVEFPDCLMKNTNLYERIKTLLELFRKI